MQKVSVLLVCRANICRSPMAEGILKSKVKTLGLSKQISVASAGVRASSVKYRPDLRAQKVTLKHGIDISRIRSRRFSEKDLQHEYILVMDREQQEELAATYPELTGNRVKLLLSYARSVGDPQVPDPYYGNSQGFDYVYELLDLATDAFLEVLLTAQT